ncbi:MAG: DUF362 domain-containing protein [Chloroflexi bacterium]|nr:DUF362 domain-containing protein [Chloroflexota bacterium]
MIQPSVAIVRCPDYEVAGVEAAVRRAVDLLGGMSAFVKPGQRVLLKINLLRVAPPEAACTTHPAVVTAVAKLVAEAGGHAVIADSPGGPYSPALLRAYYRKCGYTWAAEVSGAELNESVETVQVAHPNGYVLRRLDVIAPLTQADVVINLPKLKTHNLTGLTLAVKNLFGVIPGMVKTGYHGKLQPQERFFEGLLDIYTYVRPALNILDGVVGMEGNGPSGGDPRQVGALLASADGLALDVVAADLVGFDPQAVNTTAAAVKHGLTSGRVADVVLLGDAPGPLRVPDFRKGMAASVDPGLLPEGLRGAVREEDSGEEQHGLVRRVLYGWLGKQFVVVPSAGDKCTGCGVCARHCPVEAITIVDKHARMDLDKCIRCYCCHELCPQLAVELETPWLGRVLMRK